MNNSFMVVKGAIADDGLRKDFSKRGRVPPKNSQAERSRGPVWSNLSIRMTRRTKTGHLPCRVHKHDPDEVSISHPAWPSFYAPQAYVDGNLEY